MLRGLDAFVIGILVVLVLLWHSLLSYISVLVSESTPCFFISRASVLVWCVVLCWCNVFSVFWLKCFRACVG